MSQVKQASKRKRSRKAIPILGAAGLSLSLAGGAAAAIGAPATDMTTRPANVSQKTSLAVEEISDVSLATFYVFDKEQATTPRPVLRLAMSACGGCAGCAGCGGCWTGTYYEGSVFGSESSAKAPHHPAKPVRKEKYAHKGKPAPKNP
ncbi:MAG: hypothetical protein ACLPX7_20990 [Xanthobacteraceae bacterium]